MTRTGRRIRLAAVIVPLLSIGMWQSGEGLWIYAKATVAQLLLKRAWSRALAGERKPKPWPWADMWPVARLKSSRLDVDLIVLSGADGHALAFDPAHASQSPLPGREGTTVLTAHRDTHFAFLRKLKPGEILSLETPAGRTLNYVVRETAVLDTSTGAIASDTVPRLALVTCYPFSHHRAGRTMAVCGHERTGAGDTPAIACACTYD